MAFLKMESNGEEIHIELEIESDGAVETPFESHLFKDALVHLIEEAPVAFWMKDDGELKPEEFWAAMLSAIARSYRADMAVPPDESVSNATLLRELIEWLEREEYL